MIRLVALDIAGTTVQEHSAVYRALEAAVVAGGGSPSTEDVARWMGADKREAVAALLTPPGGSPPSSGVVEAVLADFRERLAVAYRQVPPEPFPGVEAAIHRLRGASVKVALTTGFDRGITEGLLAAIGWDEELLDAVVCSDDVPAGRPAPFLVFRAMELTGVHAVQDVLVAGDTVRDLQAGANAGAGVVVGVLTGGVPASVLSAQPHTHLVDSVADVPGLLGLD